MDKHGGNQGHSLHPRSRDHPRFSRGEAVIIVVVLSIGFWKAIWEGLSSLENWMLGMARLRLKTIAVANGATNGPNGSQGRQLKI